MRLRLMLAGLPLLLVAALAARADTLLFDPFTDPFPPSSCLQDVERHVIYAGNFCAGTCPPDSFQTNWCGSQSVWNITVPGMELELGQRFARYAMLQANSGDDASVNSAELAPGDPRIDVDTHDPRGSVLYLSYFMASGV